MPNSTPQADLGVIGLAVMGANLALNLANHHYQVAVYNRTFARTEELTRQHPSANLLPATDLKAFVTSLKLPRKIIIMVKAGSAVDEVISELRPYLTAGDILIDAGNSWYQDTQRRSKELFNHDIEYVGLGVSGGEEGALVGPSLMPGCTTSTWNQIKPFLEAIAAKDFAGNPCVGLLGTDGAGHYVKMIHNGIEYAQMQSLAEAFSILRSSGLSNAEIADVFEDWNEGQLASFLISLIPAILRKKDLISGGDLIDYVSDKAQQKGTGAWTGKEALEQMIPTTAIIESVFVRSISQNHALRLNLGEIYRDLLHPNTQSKKHSRMKPKVLESALLAAQLITYAQGLALLLEAAKTHQWEISLAEVVRLWQGGCIIRSQLLLPIQEVFLKNGNLENLLLSAQIHQLLLASIPALQKINLEALQNQIPTPVLSSCLSYFYINCNEKLPTNLIQALRDCFGAHTYQRIDRDGDFHTDWLTPTT